MKDDQDRTAKLAAEWHDQLRRTGEVRVSFTNDAEDDMYRRAGREAGRQLDRGVRTLVSRNVVIAILDNWMESPLEGRLEDARTCKAVDRTFVVAADEPPFDPASAIQPVTQLHRNPSPAHDAS